VLQRAEINLERAWREEVRQRRRVMVHRRMETDEPRTGSIRELLVERGLQVDPRGDRKISGGGHDFGQRQALEMASQRPLQG